MQLEQIRQPVANELRRLDEVIVARLASDVVLVNQVSQYIIGAGGKRLRPLSVLLAALASLDELIGDVELAATEPDLTAVAAAVPGKGDGVPSHLVGDELAAPLADEESGPLEASEELVGRRGCGCGGASGRGWPARSVP